MENKLVKLPNGCYCSPIKVHPKNWRHKNASVKKDWYLYYRFYDPVQKDKYPRGRLRNWNGGINSFKDLGKRQQAARMVMDMEMDALMKGLNIITGIVQRPAQRGAAFPEVHEKMCFADALDAALKMLKVEPKTRTDIKSVVKYVKEAAQSLGLVYVPVCNFRRKYVKQLLDHCERIHNLSPRRYNIYRAYLMTLFTELVELEAVDVNPVRDIKKRKELKRIRETLTLDERRKVVNHLRKADERFLNFALLFYHSGCRVREIEELKLADVDLNSFRYKVTIRKGGQPTETWKTIKKISIPYWRFFLDSCPEDGYVFGRGLKDRKFPLKSNWVSHRWKELVKDQLNVTADFYSLKHLNTADIIDLEENGMQMAADINSHTSTAMVAGVYDVNRNIRRHAKVVNLANEFLKPAMAGNKNPACRYRPGET